MRIEHQFMVSVMKQLEDAVVRLADFGWTMPPYLTPRESSYLSKLENKNELDDFFVDYYKNESGSEFNRLTSDLISNKRLNQWKELIEECISAKQSGNFLITIPSLITIIEGAIARYFDSTGTRIIGLCNEEYLKCDEHSIMKVVWKSIHSFIQNIYQKNQFDKERLVIINRHWILHGRDSHAWTEADSLRLFQALHTLGLVIRNTIVSDLEEDSNHK